MTSWYYNNDKSSQLRKDVSNFGQYLGDYLHTELVVRSEYLKIKTDGYSSIGNATYKELYTAFSRDLYNLGFPLQEINSWLQRDPE